MEIAGPGFVSLRLRAAARAVVTERCCTAATASYRRRAAARAGGVRLRPTRPAAARPHAPGLPGRRHLNPARLAGLAGDARVLLQRRRRADRHAGGVGAGAAAGLKPEATPPGPNRPTTATTSPTSPPPFAAARRCMPTTASSRPRATRRPGRHPPVRVAYLRHEQDLDLKAFGVRFDHFPRVRPLRRPAAGSKNHGRTPGRRRQDLRRRRRAVAAHHRVRRRQGPRDAQVRRRLHLLRARRRLPPAKFERGFPAINVRAATTTAPPRACAPGISRRHGHPAGCPDYVLHKMVTVMRAARVKISKRAGSYVTLRDLIGWTRPRRGALLHAQPQGRHRVRVRRRPRAEAQRREPGLLRAVRARAHLLGDPAVCREGRRRLSPRCTAPT